MKIQIRQSYTHKATLMVILNQSWTYNKQRQLIPSFENEP